MGLILRYWIRLDNSCLTRRKVKINLLHEMMRIATAMTNLTWIQTCSTNPRKKAKKRLQPTNTKAQTPMHPQKKLKRLRLSANGVSNVRLGLKSAKRSSRSKLKRVSQSQAGRCK
jgi:hypothetical protein